MGITRTTTIVILASLAWLVVGASAACAKESPSAYGSFGASGASGPAPDRDADEDAAPAKPKYRKPPKVHAPVRQPRRATKTSIDGGVGQRDRKSDDDDDGL